MHPLNIRASPSFTSPSHTPPESPRGFGVRWLAGNGADTAFLERLDGEFRDTECPSGVCPHPHPPHSKVTADQLRSTQIKHPRPSASICVHLRSSAVKNLGLFSASRFRRMTQISDSASATSPLRTPNRPRMARMGMD